MLRPLVLAAILWPSITLGADPVAKVKGPTSVAPGGTIVLDARESVSDKPLKWKLDGPDVPFLVLDQAGRSGVVGMVPSASPGTYKFTLIARGVPTGATDLDADACIWIVQVDAPLPPVPVPPTPGPGPPPPIPTPVNQSLPLHVTYIAELDGMTADGARVREGIAIRPALTKLNSIYHTLTSQSPDIASRGLAPFVQKAGGAPCLIVQDASGKVLFTEPAPRTEAEVIATVQRIRGGGN